MAASPRWKVYGKTGVYLASFKHLIHVGILVSVLGEGTTVRDGHRISDIVYTEGLDGDSSGSYDAVENVVRKRS